MFSEVNEMVAKHFVRVADRDIRGVGDLKFAIT